MAWKLEKLKNSYIVVYDFSEAPLNLAPMLILISYTLLTKKRPPTPSMNFVVAQRPKKKPTSTKKEIYWIARGIGVRIFDEKRLSA